MPLNLAILLLLTTHLGANSGNFFSYSIQEQSWISIAGSSNVNTFECYSNSNFTAGNVLVSANQAGNSMVFSDAAMSLQIKSFDCKNPLLNKDLYQTLGADKNPNIHIELLDAEFVSTETTNPLSGEITVTVNLTINTNSKQIRIPIQWVRVDATAFKFLGTYDINMTDFQIKPPTHAFGLIKVDEWITITFNLIVNTYAPSYANQFTQ